jgi:CRISPR-associated protein (TIGR02710 family)
MDAFKTLLVCTVGGSAEPVVAALKHWQPSRVLFVPSKETRKDVEEKIIPLAAREGFTLGAGAYEYLAVSDAQDLTGCVRTMRELVSEVGGWLGRGPAFDVVIDYTGGTKTMSAALAFVAHAWGCRFSYVGGRERTKNGVGVVVSGTEQIVHTENPWDALGFQAVEEATVLFDQGDLASASLLLDRAIRDVQDPLRKRELLAFKVLADAYDAWDRFDHGGAQSKLRDLQKSENDLAAVLGREATNLLRALTGQHQTYLSELLAQPGPTPARVKDLLANAQRRRSEKRYDDAVARLYRAIEAIAQVQLGVAHGLPDTKHVPLEKLPEPLRQQWAGRVRDDTVFLGLRDDYALLLALGDQLGKDFHDMDLDDDQRSPLVSRNLSILAHGFDRVGEAVFQKLWGAALRLGHVAQADLPVFPRLRAPR